MYAENASKFPPSSSGNGAFGCSVIYSRNAPGVSNNNISVVFVVVASGAAIINPVIFITMSSRVSENTWVNFSMAVCNAAVGTPTAPMYNVSFVPIANRDVCSVPMCGAVLTVYPADSKIWRSSGQSV